MMAAVEQFLRDHAPPPAPAPRPAVRLARPRPGRRRSTASLTCDGASGSNSPESDSGLLLLADGADHHRPRARLSRPRGPRERPRPHHPDHRAGVRRLRQRGREVPRRRRPRRPSSSASASSRASTASARPTCRWSASSCRSAASRRSRWRPSPTRRAYAPLNKGHITTRQNIQIHHIPLRDAAEFIRDGLRRRPLLAARAAATPCATSPATRGPASREDELFDPTPYAGAYVRYFVRHPTTQLMPRKVKTAFDGRPTTTARSPASTTSPSSPRIRDGKRGFEIRVGGGTSIMPRVAPDALRLRRRRRRRVPARSPRPSSASSTARTGCASTAPAPASRSSSTSSASTSCAARSRRSSRATGSPSATSPSSHRLFVDDEEANAPRRAPTATRSPNGDLPRVRALRARPTSRPQRQEGFTTVEVAVTRGDLTPEQFRGLAAIMRDYSRRLRPHDRRPEPGAALGARRGGLRGLAARSASSASASRRARRSSTSSPAPAPTPASSASPARWASTPPCASALRGDGHHRPADRRIHIKMSGCPNGCGQHHIANIGFYGASIKVGEHTIPAYVAAHRRQLRRRRGRLRHAPEGPPARQARARGRRALAAHVRGRARGGRDVQRVRRPRRHQALRGRGPSDLALPVEFGLENMNHFIDWSKNEPFQVIRGEGECAV